MTSSMELRRVNMAQSNATTGSVIMDQYLAEQSCISDADRSAKKKREHRIVVAAY